MLDVYDAFGYTVGTSVNKPGDFNATESPN